MNTHLLTAENEDDATNRRNSYRKHQSTVSLMQ